MATGREQSKLITTSKFLSYVLRHKPEKIGISLDKQGWVNVDELISKSNGELTKELLEQTLAFEREPGKKVRFELQMGEAGQQIRASQGHSTDEVKIDYPEAVPPTVLYHGTPPKNLADILKFGLDKMSRHHVHLTDSLDTAREVGRRYGSKPVILEVDCKEMLAKGFKFYRAENGVWLTLAVPPAYLKQHG